MSNGSIRPRSSDVVADHDKQRLDSLLKRAIEVAKFRTDPVAYVEGKLREIGNKATVDGDAYIESSVR